MKNGEQEKANEIKVKVEEINSSFCFIVKEI